MLPTEKRAWSVGLFVTPVRPPKTADGNAVWVEDRGGTKKPFRPIRWGPHPHGKG